MEAKIGYKIVASYDDGLYSLTPQRDSRLCVRYAVGKWARKNEMSHGPLFLYDTLEDLMRVHHLLVKMKPFPVKVFKCEYVPSQKTMYCPYRGAIFADQIKLLEEIE